MKAHALCADPPWQLKDQLPGPGRGASKHYQTLGLSEICRFLTEPGGIGGQIADDCILFLWRLASMPREALDVCSAWGFVPKAEIVWIKKTATGKRWFGMGHYTRAEHETCIIAVRGRPKIKTHSIRSTFEAPAGRHSQKPEEFYDIVEQLCDGPYLELFARRERPGWLCLGDELEIENVSNKIFSIRLSLP